MMTKGKIQLFIFLCDPKAGSLGDKSKQVGGGTTQSESLHPFPWEEAREGEGEREAASVRCQGGKQPSDLTCVIHFIPNEVALYKNYNND